MTEVDISTPGVSAKVTLGQTPASHSITDSIKMDPAAVFSHDVQHLYHAPHRSCAKIQQLACMPFNDCGSSVVGQCALELQNLGGESLLLLHNGVLQRGCKLLGSRLIPGCNVVCSFAAR